MSGIHDTRGQVTANSWGLKYPRMGGGGGGMSRLTDCPVRLGSASIRNEQSPAFLLFNIIPVEGPLVPVGKK